MPKEVSAGAVVFRRDKGIKYLILHYEAKHWDFPKGNVEAGEEEKATVKREVEEETGIKEINFVEGFEEKISYFYKKEGQTIYKEVVFYLAETKEKEVKLSFEHIGYEWLDYEKALERLTFKNAKQILEKANKFLTK
ncbi:NUDIX domain-containing protein [Candidatus Woesearchaeota archaeon]|nr:NUDIX domain-containing protein [Candidatus Woesearchaeota archaeon]